MMMMMMIMMTIDDDENKDKGRRRTGVRSWRPCSRVYWMTAGCGAWHYGVVRWWRCRVCSQQPTLQPAASDESYPYGVQRLSEKSQGLLPPIRCIQELWLGERQKESGKKLPLGYLLLHNLVIVTIITTIFSYLLLILSLSVLSLNCPSALRSITLEQ